MNLRATSVRRVPGRYQEDLGPSRADRPLFAHPDVPFDPALVASCAHPSLPLDHPGLGPSEAERARRQAAAAASGRQEGFGPAGEAEAADEDGDSAGGGDNGEESQELAGGRVGGLEELTANLAIGDVDPRVPQQLGDSAQVSARRAHVASITRGRATEANVSQTHLVRNFDTHTLTLVRLGMPTSRPSPGGPTSPNASDTPSSSA